jgi:hypothetical protein
MAPSETEGHNRDENFQVWIGSGLYNWFDSCPNARGEEENWNSLLCSPVSFLLLPLCIFFPQFTFYSRVCIDIHLKDCLPCQVLNVPQPHFKI